jgi:alanine racemase
MTVLEEYSFHGRPVWAEVRLSTLQRNFLAIQEHLRLKSALAVPKILAVVKANAYGHGAVPIAKALAKVGADWFGVACVSEGLELREGGIRAPILLLGGYWPGEEEELLAYGLTPALTSTKQLRLLDNAVRRTLPPSKRHFGVQLKINTGMNRLGIEPSRVRSFAHALSECANLRLVGTFTHFSSSELLDNSATAEQHECFAKALSVMRSDGLSPGLVHQGNSAAVVAHPNTWSDMVRPGAILYGCHVEFKPDDRQQQLEESLALEPVLSFRTRIIEIRDLGAGCGVGYDAKFVTSRPSRIAVIAAGYADGLMRGLSNRGSVLVHGKRVPIIGQISMDMAMIDVTALGQAKVGDIVTIIGSDGELSQGAGELARTLGTVVQDVLCALGRRVRRIYSSDESIWMTKQGNENYMNPQLTAIPGPHA